MTQLTVKEALAQGYTYCCLYQDEGYYPIKDVEFLRNDTFVLASKEPKPYTISDTLIHELVDDFFNNQEDVYDEDGNMIALIAEKVDFTAITEQINEAISSVKYYYPTEIQLIP